MVDFKIQLENNKNKETTSKYVNVNKVMQYIKGGSAKACNDWLRNHDLQTYEHIWMVESYDRYIRNTQHYVNCRDYILDNPIKANLCADWRDYKFCWALDM